MEFKMPLIMSFKL